MTYRAAEVLVVVDMQASYPASQDAGLVAKVEAEAVAVVARGGCVVEVCCDDAGASTVRLPDATAKVWKDRDHGGDEVYAWLVGAGLVSRDFRVRIGGVNLSACVWQTATRLAWRLWQEHAYRDVVSVVVGLCGDESKYRVRFETANG